jgi:NADH-quinone oxidoreductase subunit H
MPIAESELTMGYLTEYTGIRFTMFFLGEYASMVGLSAIAATLYLGGYGAPFISESMANFLGPGILFVKIAALVFLIIWIRFTWPRLREDQLQSMAWRWLIPLALLNIALVSIFKVAF